MKVEVQIINAFVHNHSGGNPAGVVLDADAFSHEEKQKIAALTGVSETAFVSKSSVADFKLDFYTPNRQIAHCGHATIATFSYLAQLGKVGKERSSKETIDGRREIIFKGDQAFMEQSAPVYAEPVHQATEILETLQLTTGDVIPGKPILVANTGNSFLIIPLRSKKVLERIQPDLDAIQKISDDLDLVGFYPFTTETMEAGSDAAARMFGPRYAIPEEAATGMAAGPLACYLFDYLNVKKTSLIIEQGWYMRPPSPSQIVVLLELWQDQIVRLIAGGKGMVSVQKTIEI